MSSGGVNAAARRRIHAQLKELQMTIGTILLIILVLFLLGALPAWPHSKTWGYYPSSGIGIVVVILLVLVIMGRI